MTKEKNSENEVTEEDVHPVEIRNSKNEYLEVTWMPNAYAVRIEVADDNIGANVFYFDELSFYEFLQKLNNQME